MVALVIASWVVQVGGPTQALVALGISGAPPARVPGLPTPGREEAASPLGSPAASGVTGTSFAFVATQVDGGTPVAYDPCRPIHYVTRPDGAPANGAALVADAVARISLATGLRFVDDGPTDERPSATRQFYQEDRYGDRWVPVLVSWSSPDETADLAGYVAGVGGSMPMSVDGRGKVYVTGAVTLDGPQLTEVMSEPGGDAVAGSIVLHELGHLVGLQHVEDATQIMYPEAQQGVTELGSGDLTGLAALGRGVCVPEI